MKPSPRLTRLDEHHGNWQADAACLGVDTRIFFPPEGRRGVRHRSLENAAKRICAQCPVQLACRHYALQAHEAYGVWGGLTEDERRLLTAASTRRRAG